MTPATTAKAAAITAAVFRNGQNDTLHSIPMLLAMLTSQDKTEREKAKRTIHELAATGHDLLHQEQLAISLMDRANLFEP